jgi:hypothetical protein
MKTISNLFKNALFLFLSFTLLTAGFCTKEEDEDEDTTERDLVPPIDTTKPYIVLNVINPENPGNVSVPTPSDYEYSFTPDYQVYPYGKIELSQSGDTVRTYWLFTPTRIQRATEFPAWRFCNSAAYDPYVEEVFLIRSTWFKSNLGSELQVAYPYNLNIQGRLSNDTYGNAQYYQYNFTANTYPQNIITSVVNLASGSDPYSRIEYSRIENKAAFGTFRLLFSCTSGGSVKTTEVLGKFGNIPIK